MPERPASHDAAARAGLCPELR
ncbi:hypothetical protein BVI2075_620037 [Burkholderia vietnamiensis]|nr:hypothetical protein BVI2075_620037 [Burkholderia vietnamiensis]CAG9227842.1 hypothetical protein BVI1335_690011 [Burkholderia vietnamiensis]